MGIGKVPAVLILAVILVAFTNPVSLGEQGGFISGVFGQVSSAEADGASQASVAQAATLLNQAILLTGRNDTAAQVLASNAVNVAQRSAQSVGLTRSWLVGIAWLLVPFESIALTMIILRLNDINDARIRRRLRRAVLSQAEQQED